MYHLVSKLVSPIIAMLYTIWYAFKKLSLKQSLCSMISIFASKLLGVVSVILSSKSRGKSSARTLMRLQKYVVLKKILAPYLQVLHNSDKIDTRNGYDF